MDQSLSGWLMTLGGSATAAGWILFAVFDPEHKRTDSPLRALLHGFLDLEAKDGFGMPTDIDASFTASVELILAGIEAAADRAG